MKKILAILLTTVMCFGLAACGGGQQKDDVYEMCIRDRR